MRPPEPDIRIDIPAAHTESRARVRCARIVE